MTQELRTLVIVAALPAVLAMSAAPCAAGRKKKALPSRTLVEIPHVDVNPNYAAGSAPRRKVEIPDVAVNPAYAGGGPNSPPASPPTEAPIRSRVEIPYVEVNPKYSAVGPVRDSSGRVRIPDVAVDPRYAPPTTRVAIPYVAVNPRYLDQPSAVAPRASLGALPRAPRERDPWAPARPNSPAPSYPASAPRVTHGQPRSVPMGSAAPSGPALRSSGSRPTRPFSSNDSDRRIYAEDGAYLGKLSTDRYDPESISNPYGQYGSRYGNSVNNPYGQYGSRYSPQGAANPYGMEAPRIYGPDGAYLGKLSTNRYDPDSISNPYGRYGSRYGDTVNNPYSPYAVRRPGSAIAPPYDFRRKITPPFGSR